MAKSRSAEIRARLNHPIIDSDGHTVEFFPAFLDVFKEVAGSKIVDRYVEEGGLGRSMRWYVASPKQRLERRMTRPAWWGLPMKNTLDRVTASIPKLLYERLDEIGLDFAVLYPTMGLGAPHIDDEELRRAACRAFNVYNSGVFREYSDRLTAAACIPMHTPQEAIEELEFAVRELGMKAIMMAGYVARAVPAHPNDHSYWLDTFCLDSAYDYDPVWAKCVELGVPPTFHSATQGLGFRASVNNYMYNHIGHFAAAGEGLCKALFFAGVTNRFPQLKFGFLECGVGWACSLYSDLIGHWKKRNRAGMENYNPANLDREMFVDLCHRYGGELVKGKLDSPETRRIAMLGIHAFSGASDEDPRELDDFAQTGVTQPADIPGLFVPNFYFGCEADDPINAWAFDAKRNPYGARLRAVFSSDIGHWDVPDMREVAEEAHELADDGIITEEDFRDFVFTNPARLWTDMNPNFFKDTVVEGPVAKLLGDSPKVAADAGRTATVAK
jgi:predicted TIM-barrel fold metal-dependent hydrolase